MTRHYSSVASEKELSSPIDNSTQTIPLDDVTGLPNEFPYTLILDHDTPDEEIVNVTAAAGTNLTADRGVDGTVGLAHEQGAKVVHAITARDLQESRDHEDATTDAHGVGVANSVVGTSTVQTLENKTIDADDNTLSNVAQSSVTNLVTDQATQDSRLSTNEGNISSLTTQVSNHVDDNTNVHGVGVVVGRTEALTLTNKTLDSSNTVSELALGVAANEGYTSQASSGTWSGNMQRKRRFGIVTLASLISRNTGFTDGTSRMGTLPVGWRPGTTISTTAYQNNSGGIRFFAVAILTNGEIRITTQNNNPGLVAGVATQFTVSFPADN